MNFITSPLNVKVEMTQDFMKNSVLTKTWSNNFLNRFTIAFTSVQTKYWNGASLFGKLKRNCDMRCDSKTSKHWLFFESQYSFLSLEKNTCSTLWLPNLWQLIFLVNYTYKKHDDNLPDDIIWSWFQVWCRHFCHLDLVWNFLVQESYAIFHLNCRNTIWSMLTWVLELIGTTCYENTRVERIRNYFDLDTQT